MSTSAPAVRSKSAAKATPIKAAKPQAPLAAPMAECNLDKARLEELPLGSIELDDKPDRLAEAIDSEKIDRLAASMARFGLQSRIQVTEFGRRDPAKYRLVFGSRRLEAARRLGWTSIRVVIAEYFSEDQVLAAREIENLQREDLTPIEAGLAVARLLDMEVPHYAGVLDGGAKTQSYRDASRDTKRAAVENVAQRLAKPEGWVRDCVFFALISGKARELVLDGRLPALHAREIAKVADIKRRDELALEAAAKAPGEEPMRLEDVRRLVSRCLLSLTQVSWKLDVPFAGAPACTECPHNSANAPGLFEHYSRFSRDTAEASRTGSYGPGGSGQKAPDVGVCTNRACYSQKTAASSRAASGAASKVASAVKAASPAQRKAAQAYATKTLVPSFVAPSVVKAAVERRLNHKPSKASSSSSRLALAPRETPEQAARKEAKRKLQDALRVRCKAFIPKLAAALKDPGAWAIFHLFTHTKAYRATQASDADKGRRMVDGAEMASLLKLLKQPSWETVLTLAKNCGRQFDLLDEWNDADSGIVERLAKVYGITLPPEPTVEDFLPKEFRKGAEKPAGVKWSPGTLTREQANKIAAENCCELLTRNVAKIAIINGREMVVYGSAGSGDGGTSTIQACTARPAKPGEKKGTTYEKRCDEMARGTRARGDHSGQEVTVKGARWMLGESFVWERSGSVLKGKAAVLEVEANDPGEEEEP